MCIHVHTYIYIYDIHRHKYMIVYAHLHAVDIHMKTVVHGVPVIDTLVHTHTYVYMYVLIHTHRRVCVCIYIYVDACAFGYNIEEGKQTAETSELFPLCLAQWRMKLWSNCTGPNILQKQATSKHDLHLV